MKSLFIAVATLLALAGCDQIAKPGQLQNLEGKLAAGDARMERLEAKAAAADARIAQLEQQGKESAVNWVLWRRFVDSPRPGVLMGYTPPQALSAYSGRALCMNASRDLVVPGGLTISVDPLHIQYPNGVQEFYCLPAGVVAGIQR